MSLKSIITVVSMDDISAYIFMFSIYVSSCYRGIEDSLAGYIKYEAESIKIWRKEENKNTIRKSQECS